MFPFRKAKPTVQALRKLTPEDWQKLANTLRDRPEYTMFWLGLRDDLRKQFEAVPRIKTTDDLTAYGLQCYGLTRELAVLNRLIDMPIQAARSLARMETEAQPQPDSESRPWDPPEEE